MPKPQTLGELKASGYRSRSVKTELRQNLIRKLRSGETLFPGIIGYEDTVIPQIVNALLAQQNIILLGLRGQAKSRILRELTNLLDAEIPALAGSEINDDPLAPLSAFGKQLIAEKGDDAPIVWVSRDARYVEKLATPDVTIADIIGDVDPIKAARGGHLLSDELTIHYGLLPRANRGIFAINELPDLAGKINRVTGLDGLGVGADGGGGVGRSDDRLGHGRRLRGLKGRSLPGMDAPPARGRLDEVGSRGGDFSRPRRFHHAPNTDRRGDGRPKSPLKGFPASTRSG